MNKKDPFDPFQIESHGFYMARHVIASCERAGLTRQEPFTPTRTGTTTKAEAELLLLQKEAVDLIEIYRMRGIVVPYILDETQDTWNINRKTPKVSRG